jgi:preprotein translocase subunit SecE
LEGEWFSPPDKKLEECVTISLIMNPLASIGVVALSPVKFLREVGKELKNVTWPTRAETTRSTLIVIAISIGVGLYIAALDLGFTKGFELILSLKK